MNYCIANHIKINHSNLNGSARTAVDALGKTPPTGERAARRLRGQPPHPEAGMGEGDVRLTTVLAIGAALLAPAVHAQPDAVDPGDWPRYARDLAGTRYSPLDQIDTANVAALDTAWTFRLRPEGGAGLLGGTVPLVIEGIMYLPLGNAVVALEAHTGTELWRHPVTGGMVRRGVSYWPGDGAAGPRIFYSTGSAI